MPTIIEKEIRKIVVDKRTIQNPDVRVVHNVQDKRESLQTFRFVKLDSDFKKSIKIFRRYLYYFKNKCDYLRDGLFVKSLQALLNHLTPCGSLIIGNVSCRNPSRAYMALIGEWTIIHRSREDLLALAKKAGMKNPKILSDKTGIQLYLSQINT